MNIGSKLRRIRSIKNLRLKDVADKAKISVSYLSQIENNKLNPSISTLQDLANVLDIQISDLFKESGKSDFLVIRKHEQKLYEGNDGIKEAALFFNDESTFETTLIEFPPKTAINSKSKHNGEEFTYVLKGSIDIILADQSFNLNEGDIIFYDANIEHSWENKMNTSAKILAVNTPKNY